MRRKHGCLLRGLQLAPLLFLVSAPASAQMPENVGALEDIAVGDGLTEIDLKAHFALAGIEPETAEIVQFDTLFGAFNVLLNRNAAPQTVANFLAYVDAGRYDNTIIHRSVPDFVVQGGSYTAVIPPGRVEEFAPIQLEYNLPNIRGSIAMARRSEPNSATSGFFFNTVDNTNVLKPSDFGAGYAVFGHVMGTGMSVVDMIAAQPVYDTGQDPFRELPLHDFVSGIVGTNHLITIHSVRRASVYPDGENPSVLTFTATSSHPLIAGTIIDGSRLRISVPTGASGEAEVTVRASDTNGNQVSQSFHVTAAPVSPPPSSRLANISTRATVGAGDDVLIPGFSIRGDAPLTVLIRAIGPKLGEFGVGNAVEDPAIRVFRTEPDQSQTLIAENDDWSTAGEAAIADAARSVGAFELKSGSRDAAVLATLQPGAYTVVASAKDSTRGVALVEVYAIESDGTASTRLVNTSTRAFVGRGDDNLIPGIVVRDDGPRTYLIRAIGPTLADYKVAGALEDPVMVVWRTIENESIEIARNDDWSDGADTAQIAAVSEKVGAFPLPEGSADAALLLHLEPGAYTITVSGKADTTGIALVEIYEVTLE